MEPIIGPVQLKSASHDYQGQACFAGFLRKPLTINDIGGFVWRPSMKEFILQKLHSYQLNVCTLWQFNLQGDNDLHDLGPASELFVQPLNNVGCS